AWCILIFSSLRSAHPYTHRDTLSLHDALPISARPNNRDFRGRFPGRRRSDLDSPRSSVRGALLRENPCANSKPVRLFGKWCAVRSEEHTSELQSRGRLVCRLLLEIKIVVTQLR